ncbi:hypothetical protein CTI12_AA109440 [Artemisia annua]|uniref:DUF7356 domain-containing protein n=1 Tax=Artemisia annua TaxID=35608 RepID=A0A2U1PQQ3_ARTAN|nr:hypothetical protein CTI12_AA109440 [Artemisia annua]
MIACVQDFDNGSKNLTLLVQNERDIDLKVNISFGKSTDNNLSEYKIPGHGTEKINITFPGDKSTKVILNAGNGDCELQIDRPKTTPVDTPSKSDPENTVNPKDVNDPVDSPTKPNNVNNSTDNSPVKPKDVDGSSKSKEENDPSKAKEVEDPTKPKKSDDPSKSKDVDDPSKSKDQKDPSKSKDINDPSKSKDVDDPSKSKDDTDPLKSKDDIDSSKSKDVKDPSKSKDVDDPSKSKDENTPLPKPTPTNVDTPISQNNILDQLTFYSKQVTPVYGAYFAFLIALIIGASWALCSFRKRRSDNGVPYQELEMALPESSNAADVETAGGWDQDWDDDDWDEDKAIRSPGGRGQTKSISSNGLTSRATKKDGWDADWDD